MSCVSGFQKTGIDYFFLTLQKSHQYGIEKY